MGRSPCSDENGLKKGPWTPEEDQKLLQYIQDHGHGCWRSLPKLAGLNRCGKSCRLRWTNYLRPDIKRGKFSPEEEETILYLHSILGNKWSAIASCLPGRTDNEVKNFWNTHLKKKMIQMGFDPITHRPITDIFWSLPYLTALANLKQLVDLLNQPPTCINGYTTDIVNPNNTLTEGETMTNLLNSLSSIKESPILNLPDLIQPLHDSDHVPFSHLPNLEIPGSTTDYHEMSFINKQLVQADPASDDRDRFTAFSWHGAEFSSLDYPFLNSSPPSMAAHNSFNNLGNGSTTNISAGHDAPRVWPDIFLEESLFHDIP